MTRLTTTRDFAAARCDRLLRQHRHSRRVLEDSIRSSVVSPQGLAGAFAAGFFMQRLSSGPLATARLRLGLPKLALAVRSIQSFRAWLDS